MEYSYKFRIYPTDKQQVQIAKTFGCCRDIYNYYLTKRIDNYKRGFENFTYNKCSNDMTSLKKTFTWLREVDATALQSSLRDLDTAYQNFFRGLKFGKPVGFPKFKSKHNHRQSYRSGCVNANIRILDNKHIQLPKLGRVECRVSKEVRGRILSATVSRNPSGKYFVAIYCTDVDIEPLPSTGAVVGLDMGLKTFAVISDGTEYPNHKYLAKSQNKLAKLQRQLSRKPKGSKNYEKA